MESEGVLDCASEISMECLWYCFAELIQKDMDFVKEHSNSHGIRKSKHKTTAGHHDVTNLLNAVPQEEIDFVSKHVVYS